MHRIIIIGSGGAGKSTLATRLGAILDIEVYHLDRLFWHPGWVETPRDAWAAVQRDLVARERWIIDGGYNGTLDIRLAAADAVVFLDLPRTLCLWRALKRRIMYHGRTRPDLGPGCPEALDVQFLRWIWEYPATRRPRILAKLAAVADHKRIFRLRSQAEVRYFLADMAHVSSSRRSYAERLAEV